MLNKPTKPTAPLEPLPSPLRALKWRASGKHLYYGDFRISPVVSSEGVAYRVHKIIGTKYGIYVYDRGFTISGARSKEEAIDFVEATHALNSVD